MIFERAASQTYRSTTPKHVLKIMIFVDSWTGFAANIYYKYDAKTRAQKRDIHWFLQRVSSEMYKGTTLKLVPKNVIFVDSWTGFERKVQRYDAKTHAQKRECRRFLNGFRAEHLKVACASLGFRSSTSQFSFRLTRSDGILVITVITQYNRQYSAQYAIH